VCAGSHCTVHIPPTAAAPGCPRTSTRAPCSSGGRAAELGIYMQHNASVVQLHVHCALPGAPAARAEWWQHTATSNTLTLLLKTEAAMPKHAASGPAALAGNTVLHLLLPPQQLLLWGSPQAGGPVHLFEQLASDIVHHVPAARTPLRCVRRTKRARKEAPAARPRDPKSSAWQDYSAVLDLSETARAG
jgi:hypothetical protein